MNQNRQFEDVIEGLKYAKSSLDPARFETCLIRHAACFMIPYLPGCEIMTFLRLWTYLRRDRIGGYLLESRFLHLLQ